MAAHHDADGQRESSLSMMMKDAASFISSPNPEMRNTFNTMIGQGLHDLPSTQEVFMELKAKDDDVLLTEARVFYQAQLHLTLYHSLVRARDTTDFNKIYAKARTSPFWNFVDNSGVKTIGDYAILELCVDCVMLNYLLPRLPKTKCTDPSVTCMNDSKIASVFELIYFRLMCHLCMLIEAYLELIGSVARAMMTINRAKILLTASLHRQRSNMSHADLQPRLGSPLPKLNDVVRTYRGSFTEEDLPLLKLELSVAQGDESRIDTVTEMKHLHRDRIQEWRTHLQFFCERSFDEKNGIKQELKVLLELLQPEVVGNQEVYYHIHNHAAIAIDLTSAIIDKVCKQLYVSDEQKADGVEVGEGEMTGETIYNRWEGIIRNVELGFKHYE